MAGIEAIGSAGQSGAVSKVSLNEDEEQKKKQIAYMGPSIGNLLNGSVPHPASAVQV